MNDITTALRLHLIAAGLTTPIYPAAALQEQPPPYIVYTAEHHNDLTLTGPSGLVFTNLTYTVHAEDYPTAHAIADNLIAALDALTGFIQNIKIGVCFHQSTTDALDETTATPVVSVAFRILWHR